MPDADPFESRVAAAIARWVAEAPTDVEAHLLVRGTRSGMSGTRRVPLLARPAFVLLAFMVATILVIGGALLVGAPEPRPPRVYEGRIVPTGSMSTIRSEHSATLLRDGRVLIAGGAEAPGSSPLVSAEVYDPSTGRFMRTGDLTTPRAGHLALLLADGRVLLVGGTVDGVWAETWDPTTGGFDASEAQPVETPGSVALLPDGRVLMAGGCFECDVAGAAMYDPVVDRMLPGPSMEPTFSDRWAVSLPDGRVLVQGEGHDAAVAQLYEPEGDRFVSETVDLPFAPNPGTTTWTALEDGTVLLVDSGGRGPVVWVLDPSAEPVPTIDDLRVRGSSGRPHLSGQPVVLEDGQVLFVGAFGPDTAATAIEVDRTTGVLDPVTGQWHAGPDSAVARGGATATRLADGRVLIVGGAEPDDPNAAVAEVFE
jgi:hypothetical protein